MAKRPAIYYSKKPVTVGSDNRYFVYVNLPDEYGKNMEIKVDGLSDWWPEELYPNTVSSSGGIIIVKKSTSFILHGTPATSKCECISSGVVNVITCSGGCENSRTICTPGGNDCKPGTVGLSLTPSDSLVKAYGTEDAEKLIGMMGFALEEMKNSLEEYQGLDALTFGFLMLVQSQLESSRSPMYVSTTVYLEKIKPDGTGEFIKQGTFNEVIDYLHKNMWKTRPTEGLAYFVTNKYDGRIDHIIDVSDAPWVDSELHAVSDNDFNNFLKVLAKDGQMVVGCDHSHPSSISYPSTGDLLSASYRIERIYWALRQSSPLIKGIVSDFKQAFGVSSMPKYAMMVYSTNLDSYSVFYISGAAAKKNYNIFYQMFQTEAEIDYQRHTSWNEFYNDYKNRGLVDPVLYETTVRETVQVPQEMLAALKYTFTEKHALYRATAQRILGESMISPASRLSGKGNDDLLASIEILRKMIPEDMADTDIALSNLDWAEIHLRRGLGIGPEFNGWLLLKERALENRLSTHEDLLAITRTLYDLGLNPNTDPRQMLSDVMDAYIRETEKLSTNVDNNALAAHRKSLGGEPDPLNAAKSSKFGPAIAGISLAMLSSASPLLREYGEKVGNSYYTTAADVIEGASWGTLITSGAVTTAALTMGSEAVDATLLSYFSMGATTAEIASGFVTGFGIGVIITASINTVWCKAFDPTSVACGCSPDPLWGKPQLELEKNNVNKDETINFAIYGMQHCGMSVAGNLKSNIDFLFPSKGLDLVGPCTFNGKGDCCESKIKVSLDNGVYDKIQGLVYSISAQQSLGSTDYQTLTVGSGQATTIPLGATSTTLAATCNQYIDCSSCTGATSCGWCKNLNQCKSGSSSGPSDGSCSSDWAWYSVNCEPSSGPCCCCTEFGCDWVSESYYCPYQCSNASYCGGATTTTQPQAFSCYKENDKSWVCNSPGNLACTQDVSGNPQSSWTCTASAVTGSASISISSFFDWLSSFFK
jgi:proteasome lid subunit RPN8/RPN11